MSTARRLSLVALAMCVVIGIIVLTLAPRTHTPSGKPGTPRSGTTRVVLDTEAPQPDEPLVFQDVPPDTAQTLNAARPDYIGKLAIARPFLGGAGADSGARERALDCLAAGIYYEARSESLQGQRAVAQVILNRVRDPLFPDSVCGVVFQGSSRSTGCQFTFTCDGAIATPPRELLWARARSVAAAALNGYVESSVGLATHYHTQWVVPYWRSDLVKLRTIGAHIFYGWRGREASSRNLRTAYSGIEPETWQSFSAGSATVDPSLEASIDSNAAALTGAPIAAPRGPAIPAAPPLKADEQSGALATGTGSRLKLDESAVPLSRLGSKLGEAVPK